MDRSQGRGVGVLMMTSEGSLSTFILSPGAVTWAQARMERVEADTAASSPSSLSRDKTSPRAEGGAGEKRTLASESG